MNKRLCENCRWWDALSCGSAGVCRRNPPVDTDGDMPQTAATDRCGEWADASITPEQEERQELTRRFAVAIMSTEWGGDLAPIAVWGAARGLALMESASLPAAEAQIQKENQQ